MLLVSLLGLPACTGLPAPTGASAAEAVRRDEEPAFLLLARFSMRQDGRSYVGRLKWRHDGDVDELLLSSPLGQGIAEIVGNASGARMTASDGSAQTAANVDALLQSVLSYPLPLSKLLDWLRGRNADGGSMAVDGLGRPLRLHHEGWRIDYEYDSDDPQALPGRLFVEREGGFVLRLRIDEWTRLPPES